MLLRLCVFVSFCWAPFWALQAQPLPAQITQEVEISANRHELFATGSRSFSADSVLQKLQPQANLAGLLQQTSPVFIKNYGLSNLATVSVRGATANQTALVWNGIQLNSPANGVTDLSLVPAFVAQGMQVTHGPLSALYGSGAVGGAVLLQSGPAKVNAIGLTQTVGSFGRYQTLLSGSYGGKKWSGKTNVQVTSAENDFPYQNTLRPEKPTEYTKNAALRQQHFGQDLFYYPTQTLSLSLHGWLLNSYREIPPVMGVPVSEINQTDRAARFSGIVRKQSSLGKTTFRAAHLSDYILYQNPIIYTQTPAGARTKTWLAEAEHQFTFQQILFTAGLSAKRISGSADEYPASAVQNQQAVFASGRRSFGTGTKLSVSVRKEFVTGFDPDITYSVGAEQQLAKNGALGLKTQVANSFRVPTLNERYWQPGGNLNLIPEKGISAEAGVFWKSPEEKKFFQKAEITVYSSSVRDMIVWRPKSGFVYSPINLEQVWARGAEASAEGFVGLVPSNKLSARARAAYAYTLSTQENAAERAQKNKQLMYVPVHSGSVFVSVHHRWLNLGWQQVYAGKVFTSADNLNSLPGYALSDFLVWSPELKAAKLQVMVSATVRNAFDKQYHNVINTPMPGRHYELTLQLTIPYQKPTI